MSWNQVSRIFHFLQILDYDIFTNRVLAKIIMNLPNALRCKSFKYPLVDHLGRGSDVQSSNLMINLLMIGRLSLGLNGHQPPETSYHLGPMQRVTVVNIDIFHVHLTLYTRTIKF